MIEAEGEAGVERGTEKEVGIRGSEVGVERDIEIVIEIVIEPEAIRMMIGGKGKEREGDGGVEVFLLVNNVGLR